MLVAGHTTKLNSYLLAAIIVISMGVVGFTSYYYTASYYQDQSLKEFTDSQKNLICQVRLQRGHMGDIKSEYFINEMSSEQSDCDNFIELKNLPADTQSFWMSK